MNWLTVGLRGHKTVNSRYPAARINDAESHSRTHRNEAKKRKVQGVESCHPIHRVMMISIQGAQVMEYRGSTETKKACSGSDESRTTARPKDGNYSKAEATNKAIKGHFNKTQAVTGGRHTNISKLQIEKRH